MGLIIGNSARIYRNTGTFASPTWVEWDVIDATIAISHNSVDATSRGSGGVKMSAPTLMSIEVSGTVFKDKQSAVFLDMETANAAKATVGVAVMDGSISDSSSDGWQMDAFFDSWSEGQPIDGLNVIDWTLIPARSADKPIPISGG